MENTTKKKIEEVKRLKASGFVADFHKGSKRQNVFDNINSEEQLLKIVKEVELQQILREMVRKLRKQIPVIQMQLNQALVQPVVTLTADGKNPLQILQGYIPKQDGYISRNMFGTTDVRLLQSLYDNRDFVMLIGETGSGKTHLARHIAYNNRVPYMRVNMNSAVVPEDLVGQWIPNANPNTTAKYTWQDGVLTMFMKYGGIFVVDELNMAPADILSIFHSVTDDERRLVLTQKDGEVIIANPNFWLIATMNPGYEGTRPLNLALKDRFRTVPLDYSDKVERKLEIPENILDIMTKLRKSDQINTPVSTRDGIKWRDDMKKYGETVARSFFINNFEEGEQAVVKEMIDLVMGKKEE